MKRTCLMYTVAKKDAWTAKLSLYIPIYYKKFWHLPRFSQNSSFPRSLLLTSDAKGRTPTSFFISRKLCRDLAWSQFTGLQWAHSFTSILTVSAAAFTSGLNAGTLLSKAREVNKSQSLKEIKLHMPSSRNSLAKSTSDFTSQSKWDDFFSRRDTFSLMPK